MRAFIDHHQSAGLALQVMILLALCAVGWIILKTCLKVYRNMEGLRQRNEQARQAAIKAMPLVRTGECIEPLLARSVAPAWVNVVLMVLAGVAVFGLFVNLILEY